MLFKLQVAFATLICYHSIVKNANKILKGLEMKKIYIISLLIFFSFSFIVSPTSAILEFDKKIENQKSILDSINFDWWKKLDDPYLERYISTALEKNYDIKTAALKIEQAKLNLQAQKADLMPQVSIGASPILGKFPDSTKSQGTFAMPLMASWELDLFGKNYDKTKVQKSLLKGTIYQTDALNIAIVSQVGTTYYNIVKLDKLIEIQEKLTQDRKEIYNLQKISNNEGLTSTNDLILAQKAYILAQNDLLDYQKARTNALNALAVLIGDSANNIKEYERISFDNLGNNFNIPNEIDSQIIVNRPDYKALEKQLEASGIDIRVAKKEFLPSINILGLMTFIASSGSNFNWNNAFSLLGGSANLPLFTGFKRVANLKLKKNKYEQILNDYQKTNLVAIQEINDSLYNLKMDNKKFINNKKAFEIQQQDYGFSKSKFNLGAISKLDLLQKKESLHYIEQLLVGAKMDCYVDKIGLYKTTGARI